MWPHVTSTATCGHFDSPSVLPIQSFSFFLVFNSIWFIDLFFSYFTEFLLFVAVVLYEIEVDGTSRSCWYRYDLNWFAWSGCSATAVASYAEIEKEGGQSAICFRFLSNCHLVATVGLDNIHELTFLFPFSFVSTVVVCRCRLLLLLLLLLATVRSDVGSIKLATAINQSASMRARVCCRFLAIVSAPKTACLVQSSASHPGVQPAASGELLFGNWLKGPEVAGTSGASSIISLLSARIVQLWQQQQQQQRQTPSPIKIEYTFVYTLFFVIVFFCFLFFVLFVLFVSFRFVGFCFCCWRGN